MLFRRIITYIWLRPSRGNIGNITSTTTIQSIKNDDSMSLGQEKTTTIDGSEAEPSNGGVPSEQAESAEQNKRRAICSGSIENELLNPAAIHFPPPDSDNHFVVQSFDISIALFNFQRSILSNKWKLTLKDHMHSTMAVHSILFLYAVYVITIEGTYGIKKPRFPIDTIIRILTIIQEVSTNIMSRHKGIMQLIDLDLPSKQARLVKSII
ncbi:hypothetical protein BDF20DRAFT_834804 [Mycotypha africana]|uniref:uncharacterized protein n=1 Tax=Mycotypha africana TaxID=64632 RepID=UPI0023012F89|nr:uncharacterized protein BDF20DRAFT_834804 [Mycotypha africana]KAI8982159.1 hypothetical protein BDF20DRAFT_834804 [Mycotypha africana]